MCILILLIRTAGYRMVRGSKFHSADIPIDTISQLMRCLMCSTVHAVNDI